MTPPHPKEDDHVSTEKPPCGKNPKKMTIFTGMIPLKSHQRLDPTLPALQALNDDDQSGSRGKSQTIMTHWILTLNEGQTSLLL